MLARTRPRNEVKDRYFFIDYLRLHRFGRQNQIWKKNRNMLVREHEYSNSHEIRSRKGYQSYIQRVVKSILDWTYPDWEVFKPRNKFGYEIGRKNDSYRGMLDLSLQEDKVKYLIQRNLMNNDYEGIVEEYKNLINDIPNITLKNREAGLIISLDQERSLGYQTVKNVQKIKEIHDRMANLVDEQFYIKMLAQGLEKAQKLEAGTLVTVMDRPNEIGTIVEVKTEDGYRGTAYTYMVNITSLGIRNYCVGDITIVRGDGIIPVMPLPGRSIVVQRVIDYANDNFGTSVGVNSEAIFSLSRAAIVRELLAENNMELASELRRVEATSDILNEISVGHEVDDEEEEEYTEDEFGIDTEENYN